MAGALALCAAIAAAVVKWTAPPESAERPFIEIPYVAPLAPDAGAAVTADVLGGQDGRAHAIRLISNSILDRSIKQ